jgi:hypothetical protein
VEVAAFAAMAGGVPAAMIRSNLRWDRLGGDRGEPLAVAFVAQVLGR